MGEILAQYADERGPRLADPERLAYAVKALAPFWGDLTCDAVKGATCRRYERERKASLWTVRRELGVLQAALNHAHAEGRLIHPVKVTLPEKGPTRDRWLTREELRALLRVSPPHLRRFLLIGAFNGGRPGALLKLRWTPSLDSGWVDLDRGIIHRRGAGERETKKRRGAAKMPRQLHRLMRRWHRKGGAYVVEWKGQPVSDIGKALDAACARAGVERITPHVIKHTAVTWAFQRGMTLEDASDYFDTSAQTLQSVYRQHSPDHQSRAVSIMERRK